MKTLEELITAREEFSWGMPGTSYPIPFKEAVIAYHYATGKSLTTVGHELGLGNGTAVAWKKLYGKEQTHVIHGRTTLPDVRTKCLAIADELDHGMTTIAIANKYNITRQLYYNWKTKYKDRYREFLDLPDGIRSIAKEKKLVYGDKNIEIMRTVMQDQVTELELVINVTHKYGIGSKEIADLTKKLEARRLILEDM